MRSRSPMILVTFLLAMAVSAAPLAAQGRGRGSGGSKPGHAPAPSGTAHGPSHGPSGAPPAGRGPAAKPGKPAGTGAATSTPARGNSSKTETTVRTADAAQHLQQQPQLASKLAALLPPGTNLQTAAVGFKNFGQFVAAVHVSHNLGIPFDQLRARMIGPNAVSLGQAIQVLKPTTNVEREVARAETEAREDMKIRR